MAAFYVVLVFGGAAYPIVLRPETAFKHGSETGGFVCSVPGDDDKMTR